MVKRDNSIDFFRGVAAIWIIFIHTCFWSGEIYVPVWLKSLSLIIDVPLFMFISGMTFNFSNDFFKSIKGLCKVWFKWLIFLIIYFVIILCFDFEHFSLSSIIKAMFFSFDGKDILFVVRGSLWFIFMFFIVSIIGNLIICLYNKYFKDLSNFKYVLIIIFLLYGMSLYNSNFQILSTINLMHLFIYLLGYYLYHFHFKNIKQFLNITIIVFILFLILITFNGYGFLDMQEAKGMAHINYFVYSLFSILLITFLKDVMNFKENIFNFIGKNALAFYFCQGIGSSLIYKVYPYIAELPGAIKLSLMFGVNFCITSLLVVILITLNDKITFFSKKRLKV